MAARNHINPNQLKMFMTPREIDPTGSVDDDTSVDFSEPEQVRRTYLEGLLDTKDETAYKTGLYDSILEEGVKTPIQIVHDPEGGNILGHGNHRFAVARHRPDTLIPVLHTEGIRYPRNKSLNPMEAVMDYRDYMQKTGHGDTGTTDSWAWHGGDPYGAGGMGTGEDDEDFTPPATSVKRAETLSTRSLAKKIVEL